MSKQLLSFPLVASALVGSSGIFALGLALGASTTHRAMQDKSAKPDVIDVAKTPTEVQTTAKKYYAKFDGCKVTQARDNGVTIFEFEGKGAEGLGLDIKVCANGQIAEVEREISADALPGDGKVNLAKQFPGAKTTKVEAVEMHYFGVNLTTKDGKATEVMVGPSGAVFEDEEGDEGDEGDEGGDKK